MIKNQNKGSFNPLNSGETKTKFKNPIQVAGKNPKSRKLAIFAQCWNCCGGQNTATKFDTEVRRSIKQCEISDCPLYQFRQYTNKKALKVSTLASAFDLSVKQNSEVNHER